MTLHNDSLTQELHLLELLQKTDLRETVLWGFTQVGFIYCFHHVRQRIQVCKNIAVKLLIFCNVGLPFFRFGLRIDGGPFCPRIIRLCASPSGCSFSATSKLFLWPRLRRLTYSSVRRKLARFVAWPSSRDGIGSGTGACLRMLRFRNAKSHISLPSTAEPQPQQERAVNMADLRQNQQIDCLVVHSELGVGFRFWAGLHNKGTVASVNQAM